MVVHPPPRYASRRERLVRRVVHEPPNGICRPLDGVDVKVVGEGTRTEVVRARDTRPTGIPGAVDRAVHTAGLLADVLHDVDLAAGGPTDVGDVVAQHPERGDRKSVV